jgi:hypothetical protein
MRARTAFRPTEIPSAKAPAIAGNCRAKPVRQSRPSCLSKVCRGLFHPCGSAVFLRIAFSNILILTSWSDVSTPAELSTKSVLSRPPLSEYSMRACCVMPRLAPSPTTFARISLALTLQASLARSPTSRLRSLARLDIGSYPAEKQQVGRGHATWPESVPQARRWISEGRNRFWISGVNCSDLSARL